jgi:DNA-directed RNA polymerase subunit F
MVWLKEHKTKFIKVKRKNNHEICDPLSDEPVVIQRHLFDKAIDIMPF